MIPRSQLAVAAVAVMLAAPAALAVDASCVGVQSMVADRLYGQLDASSQQQYQPVMDFINRLQERTREEMAGPEQRLREAMTEVLGVAPEAAQEQAWQAFFRELPQSNRLDTAYAETLRAQFRIHWYEALMIAAATRFPREGSEQRVAALTSTYADRQAGSGIGSALRDNYALRQLLGLKVIALDLENRAMTDRHSQTLAADAGRFATTSTSERARTGFDTLGLRADVVEQFQGAALAIPAIVSQGGAAELQLGHLPEDLPGAQARREIMEAGRTVAGRQVSRATAVALTRYSGARAARARIVRMVPDGPPPPERQPEQRRAWSEGVSGRIRQAGTAMRTLPACLIEAVGGPASCDRSP
jgi:hypothetical protein